MTSVMRRWISELSQALGRRWIIGLAGAFGILLIGIVNVAWALAGALGCGVGDSTTTCSGGISKSTQELILAGTVAASLLAVVLAVVRQRWGPMLILAGALLAAAFLPRLLSG
jgi:hypothetical protein